MNREPLLAGILCVSGAFLLLVAVGRPWVLVSTAGTPLLPANDVDVRGSDLASGLRALGLVGLGAMPALAATRGRGRAAVGLVLVVVGAAALTVVVRLAAGGGGFAQAAVETQPVADAGGGATGAAADVARMTPWPLVAALAGFLLLTSGLLVAVRGSRWAGLGRQYDAPSRLTAPAPDAAAPPERELWAALDRGEDPTRDLAAPAADPAAPAADPAGPEDDARG